MMLISGLENMSKDRQTNKMEVVSILDSHNKLCKINT